MLRTVLIALSGFGLLAAIAVSIADGVVYWGAVISLAFMFVFMLVERWRYQRVLDGPPGPQWQNTGERFIDPSNGKSVTVYFEPATGKRRYVSE